MKQKFPGNWHFPGILVKVVMFLAKMHHVPGTGIWPDPQIATLENRRSTGELSWKNSGEHSDECTCIFYCPAE